MHSSVDEWSEGISLEMFWSLTTIERWQVRDNCTTPNKNLTLSWGVSSIPPLPWPLNPKFTCSRFDSVTSSGESNGNRHLQALPWPRDPQDRRQRRSNIDLCIDLWQNKRSFVVRFGCRYLCAAESQIVMKESGKALLQLSKQQLCRLYKEIPVPWQKIRRSL